MSRDEDRRSTQAPVEDGRPASDAGRSDGYLPLEQYGVLGDGRSVALAGLDGSIDWWCVPNLDSPPLFNRLLDPEDRGGTVSVPMTVRHGGSVRQA